MTIQEYASYNEKELLALYDSVGWINYTRRPDMLKSAFAHSLLVLGAYDGSRLIGIIRCVGDGHSIVFIQDLLVHPEYQRQGIGKALLNAVLNRYENVYQIQLLTDDRLETAAFYQSLGFSRADTMGCAAFVKMR
ncbi:MAG: GNAT family N-acetyltransferase [Clostridia bacterium]|nr:GNAT family N-acetyltransferase [Clostridia bacterium]